MMGSSVLIYGLSSDFLDGSYKVKCQTKNWAKEMPTEVKPQKWCVSCPAVTLTHLRHANDSKW